jgi:hypothetical protein
MEPLWMKIVWSIKQFQDHNFSQMATKSCKRTAHARTIWQRCVSVYVCKMLNVLLSETCAIRFNYIKWSNKQGPVKNSIHKKVYNSNSTLKMPRSMYMDRKTLKQHYCTHCSLAMVSPQINKQMHMLQCTAQLYIHTHCHSWNWSKRKVLICNNTSGSNHFIQLCGSYHQGPQWICSQEGKIYLGLPKQYVYETFW